MMRRLAAALSLTVTLSPLAASAQVPPPPVAPPALTIGGDVSRPIGISLDDLKKLPRITVDSKEEGRTVKYEGVLVGELLKQAGVPLGADLRGNALATYVIARASDGYEALFSLAELDPAFTKNDVIIADTIDGKPLFAYQGPLRIVAPKDARGARSVRMLQRLEVVRLRK